MNTTICKIISCKLAILCSFVVFGQNNAIDSLTKVIQIQKEDTSKVNSLIQLAEEFIELGLFDSSKRYSAQALNLAQSIKYKKGEASAYIVTGYVYSGKSQFENVRQQYSAAVKLGEEIKDKKICARCYSGIAYTYHMEDNYPKVFENLYAALKDYEELKDSLGMALILNKIGGAKTDYGNSEDGLKSCLDALKIYEKLNDKLGMGFSCGTISTILIELGRLPDALNYNQRAQKIANEFKHERMSGNCYINFGKLYLKEGEALLNNHNLGAIKTKLMQAEQNCFAGLKIFKNLNDNVGQVNITILLGQIYFYLKEYSLARHYLNECLQLSLQISDKFEVRDSFNWLAKTDSATANHETALEDYKKFILYRDSIVSDENTRKNTQLKLQYEFDKKEALTKAQQEKKDAQIKRTRNLQYTAIGAILLIAIFLYWNNMQKQKAKTKIEKAYSNLKSTQQQLIQSEKMASLGELTAGIAHEIQNPLNFVNNFSEVNRELIEELQEEQNKISRDFKTEDDILIDIKDNEEKINHHGKRADAIVKGMLQHSRSSSGVKEPTNVNALADEYLRLAYHGLRAKDKSFNVTLQTDFDESIGKINIIPQDIGRVLLNLYNNAFYTVNEKSKQQPEGYEPTVSVSTKRENDKVEIRVKDNGNGIPQKVVGKIFQPFFTTKPTGQGTGLGLSLTYDIIKAHGGEIKVETKEGEGSEFIIQLLLKETA